MKLLVIKGKTKYYCNIESDSYNLRQFENFLFDGEKPEKTFCDGWFSLTHMPEIVTKKTSKVVASYYTIDEEKYISAAYPARIEAENRDEYPESILDDLYTCHYEHETYDEEIECEIILILELERDLEPYNFSYVSCSGNWGGRNSTFDSSNVQRQTIDKIAFPEILHHELPGKISSEDMFRITRAYIKEHINPAVAKISSDYDFCFKVEKIYPLYAPKTFSYHDIFAKTKKAREKVHYKKVTNKTLEVFNMTSEHDHYNGYKIIPAVYGNNDRELKAKVDAWLEHIMEVINHPVMCCPNCKGVGYVGENNIPFLRTEDMSEN